MEDMVKSVNSILARLKSAGEHASVDTVKVAEADPKFDDVMNNFSTLNNTTFSKREGGLTRCSSANALLPSTSLIPSTRLSLALAQPKPGS